MHRSKAFMVSEPGLAHAVMRESPLATLVVVDAGRPIFTPVPVLLDDAIGELGQLRFHLARPNPLCRALEDDPDALVIFHGPEAYVSPDWYETPGLPPTWNYVVVEARGRARRMDPDELLLLLEDLSASSEALLPKVPWTLDKMTSDSVANMMKAIVGFTVEIAELNAKAKLGQNRAPEDRRGVMSALETLDRGGFPGAHAIANRMKSLDED